MSIFDKPIGTIRFVAADGSEYGRLPWDETAAVRIEAGAGLGTVEHNGKSSTLRAGFTPPPKPVPVGTTLHATVGPGQQFAQIGSAIIAAHDQGVTDLFLTVMPVPANPDYYLNQEDNAVSPASPITGRGFGGYIDCNITLDTFPMFDANGKRLLVRVSVSDATQFSARKAIFIPMRDFTMRGFELDGGPQGHFYTLASVRPEQQKDANGNLIPQHIVLEDNEIHGWANGVLITSLGGTYTGRRNYYHDNGPDSNDGNSHGHYSAVLASLVSENEMSVRVNTGHLYKTRAKVVDISGGRFFDLDTGNSSYGIDIPEDGVASIRDTIIHRGRLAMNGPAIAWGEEIKSALNPQGIVPDDGRARSLTLSNVTIVSEDDPNNAHLGTLALWNRLGLPITNTGMRVYGPPRTARMNNGTVDVPMPGDVTILPAMPVLDTSSPVWGSK